MSELVTMATLWPKELREKRHLFNGERVQMARECRGMTRATLARELGISSRELGKREKGWHFWENEQERDRLMFVTDFPIGFFVKDDPPAFVPAFMSGYDEEGNHWCELAYKEEA